MRFEFDDLRRWQFTVVEISSGHYRVSAVRDGGDIRAESSGLQPEKMLEELKLWAATDKTICFVTHSIPEAVYLSTKIVVMSPRPGRITDVIDSPLPRERPLDIRDSAAFIEISHRVREGLRAGHGDEV